MTMLMIIMVTITIIIIVISISALTKVIMLTLDSLCPSAVLKRLGPAEASGPCEAICLCFDLHSRDASRGLPQVM